MATTTTARFKVIGIDRDHDTCECCGKTGLKLTVVLGKLGADGNTGEVVRFGRDCAARATRLRRTGAAMEQLAAEAQRQADHAALLTPVRCGEGEAQWVIESIGSNGGKVTLLGWAIGGGYHAVEAYARTKWPTCELVVRRPR